MVVVVLYFYLSLVVDLFKVVRALVFIAYGRFEV